MILTTILTYITLRNVQIAAYDQQDDSVCTMRKGNNVAGLPWERKQRVHWTSAKPCSASSRKTREELVTAPISLVTPLSLSANNQSVGGHYSTRHAFTTMRYYIMTITYLINRSLAHVTTMAGFLFDPIKINRINTRMSVCGDGHTSHTQLQWIPLNVWNTN